MGTIAAMDVYFKVGTETAIVLNMKGMQSFFNIQLQNFNLTVKANEISIQDVSYSQSKIGEYNVKELKNFFNVAFRSFLPFFNQFAALKDN